MEPELYFDILHDLSDDLHLRDYYEFLLINELPFEISSCNVIRCVEYYWSKHMKGLQYDSSWRLMNHICDDVDFPVFKWFHYNKGRIVIASDHYYRLLDKSVLYNRLDIIEWVDSLKLDILYKRHVVVRASCYGNLDVLKWCHPKGYFEEPKSENYDQAICTACENGHFEVIKWLMNTGMKRNRGSFKSEIDSACKGGHFDIVLWLDENYNIPCSKESLIESIEHGNHDMADYLYAEHKELQHVDRMVSLANYACSKCDLDILKFACTRLLILSPYDTDRESRAFVKNKLTGHIMKKVERYNDNRDAVLDWLIEIYGFRDPRK